MSAYPTFTLTRVQSSNIEAIGYNEESQTLFVAFKGSAVYRYQHVPHKVFTAFCDAESKGGYFAQHVRSVYLQYTKVDPAEAPPIARDIWALATDGDKLDAVEALAQSLHEAGRDAVDRGLTVNPAPGSFLPWEEITEEGREGRRVQARSLLTHYTIRPRSQGDATP